MPEMHAIEWTDEDIDRILLKLKGDITPHMLAATVVGTYLRLVTAKAARQQLQLTHEMSAIVGNEVIEVINRFMERYITLVDNSAIVVDGAQVAAAHMAANNQFLAEALDKIARDN